ncbi:MAG: aspartate aminotransferase family protein [Rhizobiaceae bacterium]|jgi:acetylornithine/N-succinyldiaminopimelate aminotransferase|nr:aspartate aminotransferase family protein [Rhizobiaceae bacterium]
MAQPASPAASPTLFATYNRAPMTFVRGEGCWLTDDAGARWLDFSAGVAVNSLGHAHPHLVAALTEQAGKLWHLANIHRVPGQEELSRRYCEHTFADRVFFTNSGAEAIECAIKTARRYHFVKGHPERTTVLTFEGAFHGRTLAAIAAGGQAKYLEGFGPKVQGFEQLPFADHKALEAFDMGTVAAILIEPVQGEGGIRPVPAQCLRGLRDLCDRTGALMIFDEIQTGIGRTGYLLAHEKSGVTPDIVAIAKGMGGGFPVGACLATEEAASGMTAGTHGTTYGGNPLAMAVGNAVLDVVLENGFLDHVRDVSLYLWQGLGAIMAAHPDVIETVRGEGLMIGLKCKVENTRLHLAMRAENMLAVMAGDNVVRLLPPLVATREDAREALDRIGRACAAISAENAAAPSKAAPQAA